MFSIVAVSVAGIAYAACLGFFVHNSNKQNLITRANTIAQFISVEDIKVLSGSEKDLENPAYLKIKDRLMSLRVLNPDARFIYLNGVKRGKIFFYVDSEDPESEDYSPPGQQYDEASSLMKGMFKSKTSGFEITRDRWGFWASGLVPIIDPATGNTAALLGMDVEAHDYLRNIVVYCSSALLFTALIIVLLVNQQRIIRRMKMEQESLEANSYELKYWSKIISQREAEMEELKAELKKLKEKV